MMCLTLTLNKSFNISYVYRLDQYIYNLMIYDS